jgi:hypothetical protein
MMNINDHYDTAFAMGYEQALEEVIELIDDCDSRHKHCAELRKLQKNIRTKLDKLVQGTLFPAT